MKKYGSQIKSLALAFTKTELGKKMMELNRGKLGELLRETDVTKARKLARGIPLVALLAFSATVLAEGGEAAVADQFGVDRNVVREFVESGRINLGLRPWLRYPAFNEYGRFTIGDKVPFGPDKGTSLVTGIFIRPEGGAIIVLEGSDGSKIGVLYLGGNDLLSVPGYFPLGLPIVPFSL
jgi:hypothetical protein